MGRIWFQDSCSAFLFLTERQTFSQPLVSGASYRDAASSVPAEQSPAQVRQEKSPEVSLGAFFIRENC
jgi:hypothetical protein